MKNTPIIFSFYGHDDLASSIQLSCQFEAGCIKQHQFPDEETLIQVQSSVAGRLVYFIVSLDRPNIKIIPLLFAAETMRELGASKVFLLVPYLPYMRQDKIFEPGQGLTSKYFAKLISRYFDGLLTFDPHLHRWSTLSAIYEIPAYVLHAIRPIAQWISQHVKKPVLIGPDSESEQWVKEIAHTVKAPYQVLNKTRVNDEEVHVSIPDINHFQDHTPVLVDDIISTGVTMIETIKHLKNNHLNLPICIGVHALFAHQAYSLLSSAGAQKIVTCNTVVHESNEIDISNEIIEHIKSHPELNRSNT